MMNEQFFLRRLCTRMGNAYRATLPSFKQKSDTTFLGDMPGELRPVSLINFKIIPPMRKRILALRESRKNLAVKRNQEKISVVIPYRYREEHLKKLLPALLKQLDGQSIDYEVLIVEQDDDAKFNKARLMNIGALNARSESTCFVFHDVDIVPVQANYIACNHTVRLFSTLIREGEEKLYSDNIFGGVVLVPREVFFKINGFSNLYVQWGNEDDDFLYRHLMKGQVPLVDAAGRFEELSHVHALRVDERGNEVGQGDILKENMKLRTENRKRFSRFKRGMIQQDEDGVHDVGAYQISRREDYGSHVKKISVQF